MTIQIKEGWYYADRNGNVRGPMKSFAHNYHKWTDGTIIWADDGRNVSKNYASGADLVTEFETKGESSYFILLNGAYKEINEMRKVAADMEDENKQLKARVKELLQPKADFSVDNKGRKLPKHPSQFTAIDGTTWNVHDEFQAEAGPSPKSGSVYDPWPVITFLVTTQSFKKTCTVDPEELAKALTDAFEAGRASATLEKITKPAPNPQSMWILRRALRYGSEHMGAFADVDMAISRALADIQTGGDKKGKITNIVNKTIYYTVYEEER